MFLRFFYRLTQMCLFEPQNAAHKKIEQREFRPLFDLFSNL
jgi:hypothetical protein